MFQGGTTGTVVLQSDLEEMAARLVRYVSLVALVSAISFFLALRVSSRFQSLISRPILRLAEAARRISREKDYAVRVEPEGRDEVGELIETFNDMLAGIQERDADLRDARSSLEQRVEERTQELQRELQERRRTEQELTKSQMLLAEAQRLAHVGSWEWDSRAVRPHLVRRDVPRVRPREGRRVPALRDVPRRDPPHRPARACAKGSPRPSSRVASGAASSASSLPKASCGGSTPSAR